MKTRAYLDIETTGLSKQYADLTVVGIALESDENLTLHQLVGPEITDVKLLEILAPADTIYSYNGSRFDLPFIKSALKIDLKKSFPHRDLMYDCWRKNLKGGLKAVERTLSIERQLKEVDGYIAVTLWYDYINNLDHTALKTLLAYNAEDVINLKTLRQKLSVD